MGHMQIFQNLKNFIFKLGFWLTRKQLIWKDSGKQRIQNTIETENEDTLKMYE